MASPIPTFQTLISVETFRALVNEHFEKQITEGQEYDPRDIQRFNEIDEYTLMFIQHGQFGSSFDEDRALRIFNASMSWRKKHNVYDISTDEFPATYFDRNAIYFKNHDMNNNPLLHFVVRTFHKGQEDNEAVKRFITYNLEKHVRRYPGQRIVILFDMSETGLTHLDYDLIKFVIGCGQIFYPSLLAYMLIFKMPFILTAAWKIIRTWLPTEAEQFIKFVDAKSITQFVQSNQLSTAMGGTDATNYVHIHDSINDAVEDSMNASFKKKVTFADTSLLELPLSLSSNESIITNDNVSRADLSPNDDPLTPEEPSNSSSTADSSHSVTRKSILQKPAMVNGYTGEEKVFHNLSIRPHDEIIFERSDAPPHGTADCIQIITLKNLGDKIITFKIKTTSPDKFRVKPGCSLLRPGASTTVLVYLLKAFCTSTSNINKEKFLIIWTLIGQELKQTQLIEFWKNVPSSVLYEHRLKCSFGNKPTSAIPINHQLDETILSRSSISADSSIVEMQKILKDSIALQKTTITQTSKELEQIRHILSIIFALLILILFWDVYKHFFSFPSSSSRLKTDL